MFHGSRMGTSLRAQWNRLSSAWQGWLREAVVMSGEVPTDEELKSVFESLGLTLGALPKGTVLDLSPLALFPSLEELRVNDGLSLLELPVLKRLKVLQAGRSALPPDLGARVPRIQRASLVPLARNLEALRGLKVRELEVETGRGLDLAAISVLPALRKLVMSSAPVSQLPELAALRGLVELELRYTNCSDLGPIAALRNLRVLDLSCCERIVDLSPLSRLKHLERLHLFGCPRVNDLSPLKGLSKLHELDLTGTAVIDLAPLGSLHSLRTLNLGGTRVQDLAPLTSLVGLTDLLVYGTRVRDLEPLGLLTALRSLDAREIPAIDVRPLLGLRQLKSVNLEQTAVSWSEGDALEAAMRRRHPDADVRRPRAPLVHFPGVLDAGFAAMVKQLFAADRILKGSGALYIDESCVARPGDWNYSITRMAFDPKKAIWTLWLDLYGTNVKLELWNPRDVRVGPEEFTVGGAERVVYGGKRYPSAARTAFRLG